VNECHQFAGNFVVILYPNLSESRIVSAVTVQLDIKFIIED